jgi:serine/threonine protein kinase
MSLVNMLDTIASAEFYETIDYYQVQEDQFLDLVKKMIPGDWGFSRRGVWFGCHPPQEKDNPLPAQGWKIHVTSSISNAEDILKAVVPILKHNNISFKFALDLKILALMNGKVWARQGAGKFITVYPLNEDHFKYIIEELYQATRQFDGLYILSDRRYKDSKVVFYRYGGIMPYGVINAKGENEYMLISPEGEMVPDLRRPYFHIPAWTKDPFEDPSKISQQPVDPNNITLKEGRYLIKSVLSYSNSGGVYIAEDRETQQEVVIKEARPFVTTTEDTVSLLKKEYRILSKIAHTKVAPQPLDFFQDWEHFFLVQEYLKGTSLASFSGRNNIILITQPTLANAEELLKSFKTIFLQFTEIIKLMHENDIILSDMSPNNIIILPETLEVKIIDFEGAYEIDVDKPIFLYTPGFVYVDQMVGAPSTFESDYFSLGAIMHYFLAPINQIFMINPRARYTFIESVIKDIGFPSSIYEMITALIGNAAEKRHTPNEVIEILQREEPVAAPEFAVDGPKADHVYQSYVDGIYDYILSVASYERRDRLFPAYSRIFITNPLNIAFGVCGIAQAIVKMGKKVPEKVINWILERNKSTELYPPGLYHGLAGIAWAMLELGLHDESKKILLSTYDHPLLYESSDVYHGIAGWGMANLRFFAETEDEIHLQKAKEAGEHLLTTFIEDEKGYYWKSGDEIFLGYAFGASGISLFLLYLYLASGNDRFLDAGVKALDFDINNGTPNYEGGLSWRRVADEGSIIYPYWRYGSAGVGTAVLRYYKLLGEEKYKDVLEKIFIDTNRKYAVFPGFFMGLSGLGEFLLDLHQFTNESRYLDGAYRVASGVSLFKIEKDEGIAFPGDSLIKICCDFGTGSAGVGHFLHRLIHKQEGSFLLDQFFANGSKQELIENYKATA